MVFELAGGGFGLDNWSLLASVYVLYLLMSVGHGLEWVVWFNSIFLLFLYRIFWLISVSTGSATSVTHLRSILLV